VDGRICDWEGHGMRASTSRTAAPSEKPRLVDHDPEGLVAHSLYRGVREQVRNLADRRQGTAGENRSGGNWLIIWPSP
jgi:hypothetical protein